MTHYSRTYDYKKHLEKYLVHQSECEQQPNVVLDIKTELKPQFTDMFKDMLLELNTRHLDVN